MKISSYLALLLSSVLIACGGGGGGASSGANTSSNIIQATTFLGTKTSAGSFTYYRDGSTSNPVSYIFAKDINNDGVDEVFFVAFAVQLNTLSTYCSTSVHIFGWENNVFKEITSTWLPGLSNQVEGVGDLVFGDFNGDGINDLAVGSGAGGSSKVSIMNLRKRLNRPKRIMSLGEASPSRGLRVWNQATVLSTSPSNTLATRLMVMAISCKRWRTVSGMAWSKRTDLGETSANRETSSLFRPKNA